jgi:hypothetical protein
MSRVNDARKEISSFTQDEDEKFTECWTRFKDMLMKCPPHGYEKWRLVQFFYQGLSQTNRSMIELMNGGTFLNLTGDLAYKLWRKLLPTPRTGISPAAETNLPERKEASWS